MDRVDRIRDELVDTLVLPADAIVAEDHGRVEVDGDPGETSPTVREDSLGDAQGTNRGRGSAVERTPCGTAITR